MIDHEQLLAHAQVPQKEAMRLHPFYRGKIEMVPRCCIRGLEDFDIWYTPGVAEPCKAIRDRREAVYDHTSKWDTVAIVTDGTRVLGLGDIGPEASLPVMEGKALLFKYLGGVNAVPICLKTKNPDEIISAVEWLQPSFGGIHLEDIAQPKCFYILDRLRERLEIPVWHDDQQGTATVLLAGLINALKIVGKSIGEVKMAMIGAGAANVAVSRLLFASGVKPQKTIIVDSKGILHPGRKDIEAHKTEFADKWRLCCTTNAEGRLGGISEAMRGVDVCIALSTPGPDVIKKEWVASMAHDAILFACANPIPEIWPWDAEEAGARIVATGRGDFPNQINNALGFPAIFRGVLDVQAKTITDEMCIAAAKELAQCAQEQGLKEKHILPTMEDWQVFARVAAAVGVAAQEQRLARIKATAAELYSCASEMIKRSREMTSLMMKEGFIPLPCDE